MHNSHLGDQDLIVASMKKHQSGRGWLDYELEDQSESGLDREQLQIKE